MTPESKKKLDLIRDNIKVTVKKNMKDYSNDPYFTKKLEQAEARLKKYGLPEELTKKKK